MGLYVDNQHTLCEKTHQLRRFCSLPSRAEEGVNIQLKNTALKGLTCFDYLSTSAPEMPVSSSIAPFCHQAYIEDESGPYNGSSGSLSPLNDTYDLHGHELPHSSQEGNQEPSYGLVDENNAPVDVHACDEFRMFEFKVRRCMRGRSHDWTECPFAHPGEKARRRDPRRYHYSGTACPDFRKGTCRRGDACEYAHGVFECWLHPARYRTQPCKDGRNCRRRVCFFAHTQEQMRLLPAAAAAASLTTVRSTASAQPLKPTLQCHQPSSASFMSPQLSPASTPSLASAFISPCSTPGVQGVQTARNGYNTTSAGLSLAVSQTPPLSPTTSPSYSPPHSPQQGSPNKMQAMYTTHGFHVDGSDSIEGSQGTLGRSHVPPNNMQSVIGCQPQVPLGGDSTGIQEQARAMMAGTGGALSLSELAALYHSSPANGSHQQQAASSAAMTNLLNSFSAMNLNAGSPFWLQAQMALAAAHMQAQVEEQQHHVHMRAESQLLSQMPQVNLAVPVASSPSGPATMPSALQHAGCASSPPRRSFLMGLPSPASRVEKWMGEHPVVEDFDGAGEQPFVESGRSLRAEVFTKLLKRDESHSSLCGHADLEWVSDLVRDDKSAEAKSVPGWDLWPAFLDSGSQR